MLQFEIDTCSSPVHGLINVIFLFPRKLPLFSFPGLRLLSGNPLFVEVGVV